MVFVLYLVFLFARNSRSTLLILILGFIGAVVVGITVYLYFYINNSGRPTGNIYYVNFHNESNSGLSNVSLTLPDSNVVQLTSGSSIYDVGVYATETLSATGTPLEAPFGSTSSTSNTTPSGSSSGGNYSMPYTHTSLLIQDVYFTPGGAIVSPNYLNAVEIDNSNYKSPITVYGTDMNQMYYPLVGGNISASSKGGPISTFIGQKLSTAPTGTPNISISSTAISNITVDSNGNLVLPNQSKT
jgi:hypothetical protein